jgi:hypothetical protein
MPQAECKFILFHGLTVAPMRHKIYFHSVPTS